MESRKYQVHTIAMTHQEQTIKDSDSDFLFKDSYIEDREFVYEPSFLERRMNERFLQDWEYGGKNEYE